WHNRLHSALQILFPASWDYPLKPASPQVPLGEHSAPRPHSALTSNPASRDWAPSRPEPARTLVYPEWNTPCAWAPEPWRRSLSRPEGRRQPAAPAFLLTDT